MLGSSLPLPPQVFTKYCGLHYQHYLIKLRVIPRPGSPYLAFDILEDAGTRGASQFA